MKKSLGQVFTPQWIVQLMLDKIHYNQPSILNQYILEPSCGDGAFLLEIVKRYIHIAQSEQWTNEEIKQGLETYIYGIEIDTELYQKCIQQLNELAEKHHIYHIKWNIINDDALQIYHTLPLMNFVIGNPPYVRTHHLNETTREYLKKHYIFCQNGTTDLYIAFYELGLNILNEQGCLIYITPNSFMYNASVQSFRDYIIDKQLLSELINFNTYQVFKDVSTYTAIMHLDKKQSTTHFDYYIYEEEQIKLINQINSLDFYHQRWSFSSKENVDFVQQQINRKYKVGEHYNIQYGFATLRDKIYISKQVNKINDIYSEFNGYPIENELLYPIVKGSKYNGQDIEEYIIYPYYQNKDKWVIIPEEVMKIKYPYTYQYFLVHKDELLSRSMDKHYSEWYQYGRSQGIQNMHLPKLVVSTFINHQIEVYPLPSNVFVYSGIFITGDNLEQIYSILTSDTFYKYATIVGKDLRNGYKSLNTKMIKNYSFE